MSFLLNTFSAAQTLRDFAQGQRGKSHRRVAKDLWERLTTTQAETETNELERIIVTSSKLAAAPDTSRRIARMGGYVRQVNRTTGTLTIEIPRQKVAQLLGDATVEYLCQQACKTDPLTSTHF